LSERDARALLASQRSGPLDERGRDRLIAETRGNPLALLELPRMAPSGDLAGGFGVPGGLETQLDAGFRRQVRDLPDETRRLLLVAAAEPTGDPAVLARAAAELGLPIAAAAPAEAEGLLDLGARVTFRHPLVRGAIYGAASAEARRETHAALAAASDPELDSDRRAWHRALATPVPDERVAVELERSAGRARARGGLVASAAFLERSAALTPDPARRAGRALAAAESKHDAGLFDAAERLVLDAVSGPLDELQRGRAEWLRGRIAFARSRSVDAPFLILAAAKRLGALDKELARRAYLDALMVAGPLGHREALLEIARELPADWPSEPPRAAELLMTGWAQRTIDGFPAGLELMQRGLLAFRTEELSGDDELRELYFAARVALVNWDDENAQALGARYVQLARDEGALAVLPSALEILATNRLNAGDFDTAKELSDESDAIAAATGAPPFTHLALDFAVWRASEERAHERIDSFVEATSDEARENSIEYAAYRTAVLHNGYSRYQEALELAEERRRRSPARITASLLSELIEAAVRCDEFALGETARSLLRERTQVGTDPALGLQARADALLSHGDAADALYRESIERFSRTSLRPALARSHLVYGEWLRREKRRVDARSELRRSYELLTSMGAQPFTERARRELLATGEKVRKRVDETRGDLTPQEAQIARLAAAGLTNPEIAAQLFLSARTVEYHLRKVYAKLGVESRRQLRTVPSLVGAAGKD
jgi:DNA-binding CsgD family transcriptional regulator